jgi:hypothetical protein
MGMNERIKLLAKLSGFKVDWHHEDVQALKMARFEKFAELIVRECIDTAFHKGHPDLEFLLKHFGVEEPKGWICPKCSADRTKIACPLGFGATVDGRCPMTVEAQ